MLARISSSAILGLEAVGVDVEVDVSNRGLPGFTIVGLADKAVEEAKKRVRAALKNSGFDFPQHRVVVNLAPADIPKVGTFYDLPIALGILEASGQLARRIRGLFLGELSLNGNLRRVNGCLSAAIYAKEVRAGQIFIPEDNSSELAIIRDLLIYPAKDIRSLLLHFSGLKLIKPLVFSSGALSTGREAKYDLADISGQSQAKRGLEIAAAGGHNVFFYGPPGAGKTMLARALPGIMPSMSESEILEVTKIYSISGNLEKGLMAYRPFRSPHHGVSQAGLIGGGSFPLPGEVSLAHRGILFLDELPEFPRHVLESLRQPIEDGFVTISRSQGRFTYPAQFTLVAASNPCPCGFLGDPKQSCRCSQAEINHYQKRLSGPLLDRIDIHLEVPAVPIKNLAQGAIGEDSGKVRARVEQARLRQQQRFAGSRISSNAEMGSREVKKYCHLNNLAWSTLVEASRNSMLSARSFYRIIKVAQTIADLNQEEEINEIHMNEAIAFRQKTLINRF